MAEGGLKDACTVGLMIVALVIVPLGGVFLLLYGAGLLAVRRRRAAAPDPYEEWLTLRDLMRSRGTKLVAVTAEDSLGVGPVQEVKRQ